MSLLKAVSWAGCVLLASASIFSVSADPAATLTWTGAYVGVNAGYGWSDTSTPVKALDQQFIPFFQSQGSIPMGLSHGFNGFVGGGQLGYNWHQGSYVFGLEADISYSGIDGTGSISTPEIGANPPVTTSTTTKLDWLGTVRARAGVLITPDTLLFGTGGFAYGGAKATSTIHVDDPVNACPLMSAICSVGSSTKTLAGWTLGAGLEKKITSNWTAKLEYLHFDLGTISTTALSTSSNVFFKDQPIIGTETAVKGNIVRVGLNYQL